MQELLEWLEFIEQSEKVWMEAFMRLSWLLCDYLLTNSFISNKIKSSYLT